MTKELINDTKAHMEKTIDALRREYQKIRTGRATTALLDDIKVDYYGNPSPLSAVATLAADPEIGKPFVQELWDAQIPSGKWRYYDGMLYMLAMLHASGNFKIYIQG